MRKTYEELQVIKDKYGVDTLWSFSKFNSYRTSKYEWLLKYVLKKPANNEKISAYGALGGAVHDTLEKFYNKELEYKDLVVEFDDAFTTNIDIAGLYFDRCDSTKNSNIKDKYYKDLVHYFSNFTPISQKTIMEMFLTIKITDKIIFQGYSDCLHKNELGEYIISDFKTSTKYSGKKIDKEAAQLLLYSEALRQMGVPKEKIKCRWLFLKYVTIDCEQVNGKIKSRDIERHEIGEKLQSSVKVWLKKLGYEEQLLEYLDDLVQTNDIKCLPEDVQAKYKIRDCEVYVDNIWELYEELKEEIIETVTEIEKNVKRFKETKDEKLFWDDDESLKAQSYYYNNLCDYTIQTMKPYKDYLDRVKAEKEGDLFGGSKKKNNDEFDIEDLSWLDEL